MEQNRHAAQLAYDCEIADQLGFPRVVQLEARIHKELLVAPPHGGQLAVAAVIKDGVIVFVAMDQGCPFTGSIPPASKRDRRVERFSSFEGRYDPGLARQHRADISPGDDSALRNFHSGERGERRIPVHGVHDGRGFRASLYTQPRRPGDHRHAQAASVGRQLAPPNLLLRCAPGTAAIVGGVDDDRVVVDTQPFQRRRYDRRGAGNTRSTSPRETGCRSAPRRNSQ